ncbi:MAG: spore photoproduct lyase [Limnochordia bacterium]|nr:spore photoproduct lyase [Limnochordia bacterium]
MEIIKTVTLPQLDTRLFMPTQVFFEEAALDYPLGRRLQEMFSLRGIPLQMTPSHNRLNIEGATYAERFHRAKETLVVGVKKDLTLQPCRPSADYRLIENTSCPGRCHYCYLAASLGERVYMRIYVNIDEILQSARKKIVSRQPQTTTFEASSSSDPVALEHLSGSLRKTIEFFGEQRWGRLRVVTKFANISSFLDINHQGNTRFRFSINTDRIIDNYEEQTASLDQRLEGAKLLCQAGYPIGFIIAPLLIYPHWQEEYSVLLDNVKDTLREVSREQLTFELIMHRFTARSARLIKERFPHSSLDLSQEGRVHKGFGKYVYEPSKAEELEQFLRAEINNRFPQGVVEYFT